MNGMFRKWLDAGAGGSGNSNGAGGGAGDGQNNSDQNLSYETWIKDQKPEIVNLLDGHTKGLKTALDSERVTRKDTEKQLRDLAKKAEAGSEAQTKLTEMADQISAADRRADFYEEAHKAGVVNLKLAFLVAKQDELFDSKGRINFDGMKKNYPELFAGSKIPDGNAGNGTGDQNTGAIKMDDFIRAKINR